MSFTSTLASYFPGAAEKMRQITFSHRLTSMVDQGYAGAFVASLLSNPGAEVYKFEGAVPMIMTIDMIINFVKETVTEVYNANHYLSKIHVLDKDAVALFNRHVYFEVELKDRSFMVISDSKPLVEKMQAYLKVVTGKKIATNTIILTDQGIGVTSKEWAVEKMRKPDPLFYPYLDNEMKDIWADFMLSDAPLMIAYGPAGTGKTTFGRGMAIEHVENVYLVTNANVFKTADPFASYYADTTSQLLIAEEMDGFLGPRKESGQDSGVVSGLLNYTQGFISEQTEKKIMLVTNLLAPTNEIDEALMRVGRCHSVIKFRNLTHEEACNLAEQRKIEAFFKAERRKHWSLAEVLNYSAKQNQRDTGNSVGFLG
jgi:hypothetical protein